MPALGGLWRALPRRWRAELLPSARRIVTTARALRESAGSRRLAHALFEGGELSVCVIGSEQDLLSLPRKVFAEAPKRRDRPPVSPLGARAVAERGLAGADLVLLSLPRPLQPLIPSSFLRLPGSVEVMVDVATTLGRWNAFAPPFGKYRRRIERAGYRTELSTDASALERFMQELYAPYARARFDAAADLRSPRVFSARPGRWELLSVLSGGELVAGGTALLEEDRYRFLDAAFAGDRHRQDGAGHALYALALERAAAHGYAELDLGPERPFLGDPVLHYKRQWGARLVDNPFATRVLGVGAARTTPALARLLSACPLVVRRGSGLWGLTAAADGAQAARDVARRYADLGLQGFVALGAGTGTPVAPL